MRIVLAVSVIIGAFTMAAVAAELPPRPADQDTRPCENHPDMDLAAFVAAYSAAPNDELHEPLSHFVPKDVVIENGPVKFTTVRPPARGNIKGSVPEYDLPIRDDDNAPLTDDSYKWQGHVHWPNGEIGTSPCRVRDPSGKRWLVMREGAILEYYNFDRFRPAGK